MISENVYIKAEIDRLIQRVHDTAYAEGRGCWDTGPFSEGLPPLDRREESRTAVDELKEYLRIRNASFDERGRRAKEYLQRAHDAEASVERWQEHPPYRCGAWCIHLDE